MPTDINRLSIDELRKLTAQFAVERFDLRNERNKLIQENNALKKQLDIKNSKNKEEKIMSEINENVVKDEKGKKEPTEYRIYFNDQQVKDMREMPVKAKNDKDEWVQQVDSLGKPLTETRCIIDIPETAYYKTKDEQNIDLKGYNLVMRNQFFRSEHDNGFYCVIKSNELFRLDKIQPLKDENGEIKKTPDGKVMYDFDSRKSLFVNGTRLKAMMDSWKTKEKDKQPINLAEYKDKAQKYNESRDVQTPNKTKEQEH